MRGSVLSRGCKGYKGHAVVGYCPVPCVRHVSGGRKLWVYVLSSLPFIINHSISSILKSLGVYTILKSENGGYKLRKEYVKLKVQCFEDGGVVECVVFDKTGTIKSDGLRLK